MKEQTLTVESKEHKFGGFKSIFFSLLGIFLFLVPFTLGENNTIFISHVNKFISGNYKEIVVTTASAVAFLTIIFTGLGFVFKDYKSNLLNNLFVTTPFQAVLRIGGAIMILMLAFNKGPAIVLDEVTGTVIYDILLSLHITFLVGILLMPLLTTFGAVEFIGTLISPFMKKVFKVPGYAAVDALASFVGDGTVGIIVTDEQYKNGYYTQKEAALIASTFSIVGISFASVVAEELGFGSIFGFFYSSIFVTTVIIAIIFARLPFKKFKDEYCTKQAVVEEVEEGQSVLNLAVSRAKEKAGSADVVGAFTHSLKSVLSIYFTFLPIIMLVGTVGLIIAEKTSFFSLIATPIVPLLKVLGFDPATATAMAPALIVGFTDMYLPAIFIKGNASELARFVVGVVSFAQLIFLSETGMILVKSKIGFNFIDILKLFILRTILAIPIVLVIAKGLQAVGVLG